MGRVSDVLAFVDPAGKLVPGLLARKYNPPQAPVEDPGFLGDLLQDRAVLWGVGNDRRDLVLHNGPMREDVAQDLPSFGGDEILSSPALAQ